MALAQNYAAQINGSNYDVPPNVRASGAGGNGGASTKIGNQSSKLDNVDVTRYNTDVFGSTVIDNNVSDPALADGVFAHNNQRPIAPRLTSSLATVSNDVLLSGADRPELVQSIHKIQSARTLRQSTAFRAGYWNIFTGKYSTAPAKELDTFDNDTAASPTRAVPGSLRFKSGNPIPTQANYSEKTN